ncbi:MFS transporter [Mameliella sediminis]|uniref:MFS transporter n=1 Tax=Mameliella sediminis TaxID=2836866 RepID=UPI001C48AE6D|nr:MFS transporter [Mameliella sediminis]MBY6117343.1 MFS transporter [Antarctobacter heliothermus]MBY6147199.1 MFS transporter [Mameliella alba]MBV7397396.1 MFS transporter [Mameliella sediminis]MBY6164063.1 MFS transporter [Mameliella alba]MBY6172567.1 MFS transporter [Mameliella alba]
MIRQLLPVSALLLGSALLLFAGGMHGLILPVRGAAEGFSAAELGLLGTGWAVGYVLGCLYVPRIVGAVGHIRAFGVMCAFAGVAILLQALLVSPEFWIPVRAVSGFCFAGAAMIVESWLSDRASPQSRGTIFGVYTMVNLGATTAGQMAIALGDASGFLFFAVAAIVYSLALVPTALSTSESPAPLTSVKLNLPLLWRNSPVAVAAVFLVGISNGSFGTLSAVYGNGVGLPLGAIALFASIPVLAGALAQVPIGFASDRMDRRKVLVAVALIALGADLGFILLAPQDQFMNLVLVSAFGAAIYAMYPIIVAHANDHAPEGTAIQVSGGLLMVYGIGNIAGPLIAGVAMSATGPQGLFLTTIVAHVIMILYTVWRILQRAAVRDEDKTAFQISAPARGITPETAALAGGEDEAEELEEAMEAEEADQARSTRTDPTE